MSTECFLSKLILSVDRENSKTLMTISIEPTQGYQVELEGVKYCLFVAEKKLGNNRIAVLREMQDCQLDASSMPEACINTLIQSKLNRARVRLVTDDRFKTVKRIELI